MSLNFGEMMAEAKKAVQTASGLVKKIQQETTVQAMDKEDHSPVTIADFSSQAVVSKMLQDEFGSCVLVGEENSEAIRESDQEQTLTKITAYVNGIFPNSSAQDICDWIDYGSADAADSFWTVDPIDGTKGFLRGDQYVVALAYILNGTVKIGVLGCPKMSYDDPTQNDQVGSLVYAIRGQGAWISPLNDLKIKRQLHVSTVSEPEKIRLLRSFESGHTNTGKTDLFLKELGTKMESIPMDSQAKYTLLANGDGELLLRMLSPNRLDYKEKIWDQAAGSIILEEAGGKITDLYGNPLDFTCGRMLLKNTGILASNQWIHARALHALSKVIE